MRYYRPDIAGQPLHQAMNAAYLADETPHVRQLCKFLKQQLDPEAQQRVREQAEQLVLTVRSQRRSGNGIDAFMHEYQLSSQEGIVLMCLAEALLRIPDAATVDKLISDKLGGAHWEAHLGKSDSLFVNASTWGLMISGRLVGSRDAIEQDRHLQEKGAGIFRKLLQRSGEPVIRQAVRQAMRIMGHQFVMGRSIDEALKRAGRDSSDLCRYSFDMLGEAARTEADSQRYQQAYLSAIASLDASSEKASGISVKLSALHPRYELAHGQRVMTELLPRLEQLVQAAVEADISLTIDAEEADRLDLSLQLLEVLALNPAWQHWQGLGLAVQAYQKRAPALIDWLADLCQRSHRRLNVRLVKGAYWDTEIKRAQERGLPGYPVFTRKAATDVSYLACAAKLLEHRSLFYPQFATHNAQTVAAVIELAGSDRSGFEFQRLHGMGKPLHEAIMAMGLPCRIYAPVGSHEDLLPYLVRRLLENGANTSFVNRLADDQAPVSEIIADPLDILDGLSQIPHPAIPLPQQIYPDRRNSAGMELADLAELEKMQLALAEVSEQQWLSDHASPAAVEAAYSKAVAAQKAWQDIPVSARADCLLRYASLLEQHRAELIHLCQQEAGKTLADSLAEVREAVDFCHYYAAQARQQLVPRQLAGPTGETNSWEPEGRGVFVCISPWNFPLAIFTGQVTAALVTGNAVLAKPAEQTPLIAGLAVRLMHEAGIPADVMHCLPGDGELGATLVNQPGIAGVAFTGSTATAHSINRQLAARDTDIPVLIAETGGQNAMLVDSSALLEQVVVDVIASGFHSAGQRCSALRILLVQEEVAPRLLTLLSGAMAELSIGDPYDLATDIGPVIDDQAKAQLEEHVARMNAEAELIFRCTLPETARQGTFFPPHLYRISSLDQLHGEVFGPIVHAMTFQAAEMLDVIDAVNRLGYGLTFGIHSRIDSTIRELSQRIRAGNVYVNRNMTGAVVGVQPFGGMGMSGTGPKAGGPFYLSRFCGERSVCINTTAAGGNASLMTL